MLNAASSIQLASYEVQQLLQFRLERGQGVKWREQHVSCLGEGERNQSSDFLFSALTLTTTQLLQHTPSANLGFLMQAAEGLTLEEDTMPWLKDAPGYAKHHQEMIRKENTWVLPLWSVQAYLVYGIWNQKLQIEKGNKIWYYHRDL